MEQTYKWPYENEAGQEETLTCDVLVLGGGLSGCFCGDCRRPQGASPSFWWKKE